MSPRSRLVRTIGFVALFAAAAGLVACASTRERRGSPTQSGFLGDYSQLKKNPDFPAAEVYVNPRARWSAYDAVQIDSVGLWSKPGQKQVLKEADRQMLTDLMYKALHEAIGEFFVIADHPGPDTLRLRAALTQEKGANVPLRTVTTVVPQLRALTTLSGLAADVAMTVGTATVEVEVSNSITNERLAAAVDSRAGTKALFTKRAYQKWGDVEYAANLWAKRFAWQLAKHGVRRKPGTSVPDKLPEPPRQM